MKKQICSSFSCLLVFLLAVHNMMIEAQECQSSGQMSGTDPPPDKCNPDNGTPCCKAGEYYTTYECSPPVSQSTQAIMTKNSFQKGGDGGAESACDGEYHNDNTLVVALSTGWFNNKARCNNNITIYGNENSVNAIVVDECASNAGCDEVHDYQQPCRNNIVDASEAVWEALGVERKDWGSMDISWSDA